MPSHHAVARSGPTTVAPLPTTPAEATEVDLRTLRLVLHQHVDDLRGRGAPDEVLAPIEAELRRYDATVDELLASTS